MGFEYAMLKVSQLQPPCVHFLIESPPQLPTIRGTQWDRCRFARITHCPHRVDNALQDVAPTLYTADAAMADFVHRAPINRTPL